MITAEDSLSVVGEFIGVGGAIGEDGTEGSGMTAVTSDIRTLLGLMGSFPSPS